MTDLFSSHRPANVNVFHETQNTYSQAPPRPHSHYEPATYSESSIEIDHKHKPHYSAIDRIEREYRARVQPSVYREDVRVTGTTVDTPTHHHRPQFGDHVTVTGATIDAAPAHIPHYADKVSFTEETVDAPKVPAPRSTTSRKDVKVTETTVYQPRHTSAYQKSKMGYYDEDG